MIQIRRSKDRGQTTLDWLDSKHTFSFGSYYDPTQMGFSVLRVINEDWINPDTGFGLHPHQDMEILSYVIEGAMEHQDSIGNKTIIRPGELQRMSAGTGIRHSEQNFKNDQKTHFLQIWILPEKKGVAPSYDQKSFIDALKSKDWALVASREGRNGSVSIHQDIELYVCRSKNAGTKTLENKKDRKYWIQVVDGKVQVQNETLMSGDGAGITEQNEIEIKWQSNSEFLVFDLP